MTASADTQNYANIILKNTHHYSFETGVIYQARFRQQYRTSFT